MFKDLNCIIVDDEPAALKGLSGYINRFQHLHLIEICENAIDASHALKKNSIDLMFLDVNMPGKSGIDFLKTLQNAPITIITSAYPEYAIDGFELDVIDFLVKPISFNRFEKSILKASDFYELTKISNIKHDEYIFIKCNKKIEKIFFDEIILIESMHNYISIVTESARLIAYTAIKDIEKQLPEDRFVRIQRSYIVSKLKVKSIKDGNVYIGNQEISISRNGKSDIIEKLLNNNKK